MRPLSSPAAERNKQPILEVLRRVLPERGVVLEIASGTGQHAVYFAQALPALTWQPSDPDAQARQSIAAWHASAALPNLLSPLELDVRKQPWPVRSCDAIVCINMIHISPFAATEALFAGAAEVLPQDGVLLLYGPFRMEGAHTAPSNQAFDASLRAQNPEWGVRDLREVAAAGRQAGFAHAETLAMPANNFSVVFRRL